MIDRDDILAALESTARRRGRVEYGGSTMPTDADIAAHRDTLLRFLEELDVELTVSEVIEVLEDWR